MECGCQQDTAKVGDTDLKPFKKLLKKTIVEIIFDKFDSSFFCHWQCSTEISKMIANRFLI